MPCVCTKTQAQLSEEGEPSTELWLLVVVFLVTVQSPKPELVSIGHGIEALSPHGNLRLPQLATPVAWLGVTWRGMACCAVAALIHV